jgi:hypothetical protein
MNTIKSALCSFMVRFRGGIFKTSYDELAIILKGWVPYMSKVYLKGPITLSIMHPIQNNDPKMFIGRFSMKH